MAESKDAAQGDGFVSSHIIGSSGDDQGMFGGLGTSHLTLCIMFVGEIPFDDLQSAQAGEFLFQPGLTLFAFVCLIPYCFI